MFLSSTFLPSQIWRKLLVFFEWQYFIFAKEDMSKNFSSVIHGYSLSPNVSPSLIHTRCNNTVHIMCPVSIQEKWRQCIVFYLRQNIGCSSSVKHPTCLFWNIRCLFTTKAALFLLTQQILSTIYYPCKLLFLLCFRISSHITTIQLTI